MIKYHKNIVASLCFGFVLAFGMTGVSQSIASGQDGLNYFSISEEEFDYGPVNNHQLTVNYYIDSSEISEADLFNTLLSYYEAERTVDERIDAIDISSGDSCAATVCVTVVEDYGSYTIVQRNNYHLQMSAGSLGGNSYSSYSGVSSSDPDATSSQLSQLASINKQISDQNTENAGLASEIAAANSELSSRNSAHASAKSALASAENDRNVALSNMNDAISNRNSAVAERHQAKQEASNAKEEADRQAAAVVVQEQIKAQQETQLAELVDDTTNLLAQSPTHHASLADSKSGLDSEINSANAEIDAIVDRHNAIASNIISDLGIVETVEDLNIDYSALIKTENDLSIPTLPNGQAIKTPETHPRYEDLVDAINYHKSLEEYVESTNSDSVKHAYDLSEIGIIQADEAYSEGRDEEGDEYLEGALSLLDTALDFVPGVSFIKDVTSIVTGVNPITGEEVSDTDRAIMLGSLFLPAALSGTGKIATKAAKALEILSERGSNQADGLLDVMRNADSDFAKYANGPCGRNISSLEPDSLMDWAKVIAFKAMEFLVPYSEASITDPCPIGSVLDDVLDNNTIRPETFTPGKKDNWSEHLNKPQRNHIYKLENGSYQTDHLGRTKLVEAKGLELKTAERNSYQQTAAGGSDRLETDVGGHLWGSRFNGPGEAINLVPMDKTLNSNAHDGGAFGRLEMRWAEAVGQGSNVSFSIRPNYTGDSLRPDYFDIVETIDGVTTMNRMYNKAGG